MPYTTADARQQLLDTVGKATEALAAAVAALGEAYEQLDERSGDALEGELFRPVQHAYGRARRTRDAFAERHDLVAGELGSAALGAPSRGARGLIDDGVEAARRADEVLATLQDSMLPVEVGDPELRAGLEEVRTLLGEVPARAREIVRTLGR
ncbi:MAG TPA: hypothetical protein VGO14_10940 [Solirubrobacteraceae bacterium]|jgi:hypothetical protein|nr:hypothetical protein [Solirubrobacteraceae bacterium]